MKSLSSELDITDLSKLLSIGYSVKEVILMLSMLMSCDVITPQRFLALKEKVMNF